MNDWDQQRGIERASGSEELDHLMQQELRDEQMRFYQRANQQPVSWNGDMIDTLFGIGVFLFVVGFLVYAAWGALFG